MHKKINWLLSSEYGYLIIVVFLIILTNVLLDFNFVQGESMHPTLLEGELVVSENISSYLNTFHRGDIVIADPNNSPVLVIKRVIAVPGDKVEYKDGQFWINDEKLEEDYIIDNPSERVEREVQSFTLGNDEYYIVGDNRNFSHDSLAYGPIHVSRLKAKLIFGFKF